MADVKHALLLESLKLHFEGARISFKRSLLLCLAIAVAGSIAMAIAGNGVAFFFDHRR